MARVHIGIIERVELRPKQIALEIERIQDGLLLLRRARVSPDVIKREFRIARRLGQAHVKVCERCPQVRCRREQRPTSSALHKRNC